MRWNLMMLYVVVALLALVAGTEFVRAPIAAEALAEKIAPQLDVSEALLRESLRAALFESTDRRVVFQAAPLALVALLLTLRLIADRWRTRDKKAEMSE